MIDDLQKLCVAALRRRHRSALRRDVDRSASPRLDRRAVNVIFECGKLKDGPFLQCEATLALVGVYDRLSPKQRKVVKSYAIPNLFVLFRSSDTVVGEKAVAALLEILHSQRVDRWNLVLGPLLRRVMGKDPAAQKLSTTRFSMLLSIVCDPPIQRVIDSGVIPRFVEFLRREEYPELQYAALSALVFIAVGTSGQAKAVRDAGAIPNVLRLLHPADDEGKEESSVGSRAHGRCESRFPRLYIAEPRHATAHYPGQPNLHARSDETRNLGHIHALPWGSSATDCAGTSVPADFVAASSQL